MGLETIDKKRARLAEIIAKKALVRASYASSGGGGGAPGVPLTVVAGEVVAHVNQATGVDAPATDGSAAHPFQTIDYLYRRLVFLTESAIPNLIKILTPAAPTLHVYLDTSLTGDDPVGLLQEIYAPYGSNVIVDGTAAMTAAHTGALTAVAQVTNFALNPAHFQVLTLDAAATAFWGLLLFDTQAGSQSAGWIYRAGVNGGGQGNPQVAGANNMGVSSMLSEVVVVAGVPQFRSPAVPAAWPNTPTLVTPGGTDTCVVRQLGSFQWQNGGPGFAQGGSIAGSFVSAQLTFLNLGFVDGGELQAAGYGAQVTFAQCSFTALTFMSQAVSLYNCSGAFVSQRALDHYFQGGWVRNTSLSGGKLGINQADNLGVDAGTIFDGVSCQIGSAGGASPSIGSAGFYIANVNTPGIDLDSGVASLGGGAYSGQLGYLINNGTYPFRSAPNTYLKFQFSGTFGALGGVPSTIGIYPYPLAIYATYLAIIDPYTNAFGGSPAGELVYSVSQFDGQDTAGGALANALVAQPGSVSQFYVNAIGGGAWAMDVQGETQFNEVGGAPATAVGQLWVDGAPVAGEPTITTTLLANELSIPFSRRARITGLANGLHTFALALQASAGAVSTPANATRVTTTVTPRM